jgi:hypothetical protein
LGSLWHVPQSKVIAAFWKAREDGVEVSLTVL